MNKEIEELIEKCKSKHFAIPDQAHRSSKLHTDVSTDFAVDIIDYILEIDDPDDTFDAMYALKDKLSNIES